MSSRLEYIEFICEQVASTGEIKYKKMFGEYMVYCNDKPIILICDDVAFVKINDLTSQLLAHQKTAIPYNGAKLHYVLDVDNKELLCRVVTELEKITPLPRRK